MFALYKFGDLKMACRITFPSHPPLSPLLLQIFHLTYDPSNIRQKNPRSTDELTLRPREAFRPRVGDRWCGDWIFRWEGTFALSSILRVFTCTLHSLRPCLSLHDFLSLSAIAFRSNSKPNTYRHAPKHTHTTPKKCPTSRRMPIN